MVSPAEVSEKELIMNGVRLLLSIYYLTKFKSVNQFI